jgi:hypothetical protein
VLVSSVLHGENLLRGILSGYKTGQPHEGIRYKHRAVAFVLALAVGAFWIGGSPNVSAPLTVHAADRHHVEHQRR